MLAQELPHLGKCQMLYDAALTRPIREHYQLYIHRRAVDKESSPAACTYAGMHPSLRGSRYILQGVDEVWSEAVAGYSHLRAVLLTIFIYLY